MLSINCFRKNMNFKRKEKFKTTYVIDWFFSVPLGQPVTQNHRRVCYISKQSFKFQIISNKQISGLLYNQPQNWSFINVQSLQSLEHTQFHSSNHTGLRERKDRDRVAALAPHGINFLVPNVTSKQVTEFINEISMSLKVNVNNTIT